ncbi:hypothetical protein GC169_10720 [bacterium]|nr:hypothetical protein [bacterium]
MAVLHLRRSMVVDGEVEADRTRPKRPETITVEPSEVRAPPSAVASRARKPVRKRPTRPLSRLFLAAAATLVLGAYPLAAILSSDVGERIDAPIDRTQWAAPWAGAIAGLLKLHDERLGWANAAPSWSPEARLTAKPAYQAAMVRAVGQFATLAASQRAAQDAPDPNLEAASRLLTGLSGPDQIRAARDALAQFDLGERRRTAESLTTLADASARLRLIASWALDARADASAAASRAGGLPFDRDATIAVYAAKGRAQAAMTILEALDRPNTVAVASARERALASWEQVVDFRPLIVMNGAPDSLIGASHAAAIVYLLSDAEAATDAYARAVFDTGRTGDAPGLINGAVLSGDLLNSAIADRSTPSGG